MIIIITIIIITIIVKANQNLTSFLLPVHNYHNTQSISTTNNRSQHIHYHYKK